MVKKWTHSWSKTLTNCALKLSFWVIFHVSLLVGTQADLRDDPIAIEKLQRNKQKPIGTEQAERLARDLKVST